MDDKLFKNKKSMFFDFNKIYEMRNQVFLRIGLLNIHIFKHIKC